MSCKNCTERQVGCHASCEVYKEYRNEIEKQNVNRRQNGFVRAPHSAKVSKTTFAFSAIHNRNTKKVAGM